MHAGHARPNGRYRQSAIFYWLCAGVAGTIFWVDPKEQLVAIYMVQASEGDTRFLRNQFRTMVQAAIVD